MYVVNSLDQFDPPGFIHQQLSCTHLESFIHWFINEQLGRLKSYEMRWTLNYQ